MELEERGERQEIMIKHIEENVRLRQELVVKDIKIAKMNQELEASEMERAKWEHQAVSWKEIVKLKRGELVEKYNQWVIEKSEADTRIQFLAKKLDDQKETNKILERQLEETKQNVCLPDTPTHKQVGKKCIKYAAATWIRRTLIEQFLRNLPTHYEIIQNFPHKMLTAYRDECPSVEKEAKRWNLNVEGLNMSKQGAFDRANKLLEDGHPLLLRLTRVEWGPIQRYIKESSAGYLGLQEWNGSDSSEYTMNINAGHALVITEYIPPKDEKPGLYKIKNSHGEYGGSPGRKGHILIEDNVLRAIAIHSHILFATSEHALGGNVMGQAEIRKLGAEKEQLLLDNQKLGAYIEKLLAEEEQLRAANQQLLEYKMTEERKGISNPTHMSVATSIWEESNQGFWKETEQWKLKAIRFTMTREGDFGRVDNFLERGYPLLLTLKPGEWEPIQKYIYEASSEDLGLEEWETRRYQPEGHAVVVTEYIPPNNGQKGMYKIKTSLEERGGAIEQKGYILIEDNVLRSFNVEDVRVEIPVDEWLQMLFRGEYEGQ